MVDHKDDTAAGAQRPGAAGRSTGGGSQAASSGATSATKPPAGGRSTGERGGGEDVRGMGDRASDVVEQARGFAGEAVEQARGMAGQLAHDVRQVAESLIEEQKGRAVEKVAGVAEALRKTAEDLGEQNEMVGRYAEQAAETVERFAESVRDRNLGDLVAEVDDFARRQPTMFLVGAVALGFVVGRFMAASSERARHEYARDDARSGGARREEPRARTAGYGAIDGRSGNGHAPSYRRGNA